MNSRGHVVKHQMKWFCSMNWAGSSCVLSFIYLEGLRKITKLLSQCSQFLSEDSKCVPSKYMLLLESSCCVPSSIQDGLVCAVPLYNILFYEQQLWYLQFSYFWRIFFCVMGKELLLQTRLHQVTITILFYMNFKCNFGDG